VNNSQFKKLILFLYTFFYVLINPCSYPSGLLNNLFYSKNKDVVERKKEIQIVSNLKKTNLSKTQIPEKDNSLEKNNSPIKQLNISNKEYIFTQNELEIESQVQSERNNILYAEGKVIVQFKGTIMNADSLIYDKSNKIATAKGNVRARINNQIFEAQQIKYDFVNQKGRLFNVKGFINGESIISDLDFKFKPNDVQSNPIIQEIYRDKVLHTPDKVINWIFSTDEIIIDENKWLSKKVTFTNDLLESKQIQLVFNDLEVSSFEDKLRFNSKINYLILEEKIVIPFWIGDRTIVKNSKGNNVSLQNRWNIGFDNLDKDGFFIGRKLNSVEIKDNLFLNIEPQFFIQRSLKGRTNSFVKQDSSLNSKRVSRDITPSDYFGLNSTLEGNIDEWSIKLQKELNSLDMNKFSNALRFRSELSRNFKLLNTDFKNRFYTSYRNRLWNGSMGESEIYGSYGWQLDRKTSYEIDGKKKSQNILFGIGNFKAEDLHSSNLIRSIKSEIFYESTERIPIYVINPKSKFIDNTYKYIPAPIKKGIFINTKFSALYNLYENNSHQEYIGFGLGPNLILGNLKNNAFDYTHLSILPFYKFKSGQSVFKHDQISDRFTVALKFAQHLLGPLHIETSGTINLDNEKKNYGEFIDSKITLKWSKRTYKIAIFYQPSNESGGIIFSLFGFE
tara:strand:+ start:451 stop:2475 length:2025 start_codon:yes stop_codon:yes gene_type:complete